MAFARTRAVILYGAPFVLVLGVWSTASFEIVDDAYITFRYAHNLAHHGQLVFNRGEPVEAISNLLWALVLTPAARIGAFLPHAAIVLSLLLTAIVFVRLWHLAAALGVSRYAALAGIALVAGNTSVLQAWTSGLEGALFAALLMEMVYRYAKGKFKTAALMAGLLAATRPEGIAGGLLMILVLIVERRSYRIALAPLGIWLGAVVSLIVFRLVYYGSPVPNSVMAKAYLYSPGEWPHVLQAGLDYAWGFIKADALMVALAGLAILCFVSRRPSGRTATSSIAVLCVVLLLWSFAVVLVRGGDWMPAYRLFSLYGALYGVLCLHIPRFCSSVRLPSRFIVPVLVLLGIWPAVYTIMTAPQESFERGFRERINAESTAPGYPSFARRLTPLLRHDDVVASEAIGLVSYRLIDTRIHDILGIADPYIARTGMPIFQFGKVNLTYTVDVVRPAVMLCHSPRLLWPPSENLTDFYTVYHLDRGHDSYIPLMLVRNDCRARLEPVTRMLTKVNLTPKGIAPAGEASTPAITPKENDTERVTSTAPGTPGNQPAGRWRPLTSTGRDTDDATHDQLIDKLEALGYVAGSRQAPDLSSVTILDAKRAYESLNLYTSGHAPVATLCDMEGKVVHRWGKTYGRVWPKREIHQFGIGSEFWRRARVLNNGDLLAIFDGLGIIRLDRTSNILWARPNNAHHDFDVAANGDIYLLAREPQMVPALDPDEPLLEDYIVVLDSAGNEKKRISLLDCFQRIHRLVPIMHHNVKRTRDILHTNSIEILRMDRMPHLPGVGAGDVLVSSALLHSIAIVNMEEARIVWWKRGDFKLQHDPAILSNGTILLFDNLGLGTHSRVLEFQPATMRIVWEYKGTEREPFFTTTCGANQRLPNGNTLITESDNGRAFEVTAEGEIVWEFYNPHRAGDKKELIATLFEMRRLPAEFPTDWLRSSE